MKSILALVVMATFASCVVAQDKPGYPLTLEIKSYSTVTNGYYTTPRQYNTIGDTTIATGGSAVPRNATINTAILTTPSGKLRCTLWNKKHYLFVETFHVRQISGDELEVPVTL